LESDLHVAMDAEMEMKPTPYEGITFNLAFKVYNIRSGYSSGPGRQVIHTIRPAQPRDTESTIVSGN